MVKCTPSHPNADKVEIEIRGKLNENEHKWKLLHALPKSVSLSLAAGELPPASAEARRACRLTNVLAVGWVGVEGDIRRNDRLHMHSPLMRLLEIGAALPLLGMAPG